MRSRARSMRLAGRMTPFFIPIFLLGLSSLVNAANFTQVFEFNNEKNYNTTKASLEAEIFNPRRIMPFFMAAYGPRLFFSMFRVLSTPVTLVSLHTSSASSASPKFTPFPSLNIHGQRDCDKLGEASGLQVDSVGRLWVLDQGSFRCSSKIWTIDLKNNDQTKLTHRFSFQNLIHDFVLDETPNGTFAYITEMGAQHIVVFSLERNESWIVDTPGKSLLTIALSPKVEPRKLYLSEYDSDELYSISIAALRNGSRTANPELIGNWTAEPYRMLMDNQGTLYAAFWGKNYISSWNSSQPFAEHRFHEVAGLNTDYPFSFNLDQSGTFWMTEFDDKSNILTVLLDDTRGAEENVAENGAQRRKLIDSSVFFVILLAMAIL